MRRFLLAPLFARAFELYSDEYSIAGFRGEVMYRFGRVAVFSAASAALALAQPAAAQESSEAFELPEVVVSTGEGPGKSAAAKQKKKTASQSAPVASAPKKAKQTSPAEPAEPEPGESAGGEAAAFDGTGTDGGVASGAEAFGGASGVSFGRTVSNRVVEQVGTVEEVSAAQIEASGARTLNEAIQLMPGIHVRNGGDGVPRIDIRGMRTRNVTLLLDGVPLNATFDGQFDPRSIPVENIARIKVTRGGSSVLYGPGGNAAVIDIITKGAAPGLHTTSEVAVGFGKEKDARATASYGSDTIKTFVSASIYKQDNFDLSKDFDFTTLQPNRTRVNSDREDRNFYANTEAKITEDVSWGVSINYREGEYGKPPTTIVSDFAPGLRYERVDDYSSLGLQTTGRIDFGGGLSVRPTAYFNNLTELTNRFDDDTFTTQATRNGSFHEDATTQIYGAGGQFAYQMNATNLITLALDAHRETWESDGFQIYSGGQNPNFNYLRCPPEKRLSGPSGSSRRVTCLIDEDHDIDVYSAALEYETQLTKQLSAVLGGGWVQQDREGSSDDDYTYLAGLRFALTDETAIRGSIARKIRFPTLRNLYGIGEGNGSLQTEVTENYEVGLDQQLPAIDGLFTVSVFRINAENFIKKGDCDGLTDVFCNFESLRYQGVETNLAFKPMDNLNLQIGYTYLDSKNLAPEVANGSDKVDNNPRHTLMAAASYTFDTGTTLLVHYQYVAGSYAVSRNLVDELRLDDYHLLNLGITQDIAGGVYQLYGRVENVLDEDYETSFGFPEAGRTFFIGLRTKL